MSYIFELSHFFIHIKTGNNFHCLLFSSIFLRKQSHGWNNILSSHSPLPAYAFALQCWYMCLVSYNPILFSSFTPVNFLHLYLPCIFWFSITTTICSKYHFLDCKYRIPIIFLPFLKCFCIRMLVYDFLV